MNLAQGLRNISSVSSGAGFMDFLPPWALTLAARSFLKSCGYHDYPQVHQAAPLFFYNPPQMPVGGRWWPSPL